MTEESYGTKREAEVRGVAARLGVADFVYHASATSKGTGMREAAGDGILMAGDHGAILQVKTRDPEKAAFDSEAEATAWIRKNASRALRQGRGTRRELNRRRLMGAPIDVIPVRAIGLPESTKKKYEGSISQDVSNWPIIVIIDHPSNVIIDLGFEPDAIWLNFADWTEIQRRLRSTRATLEYARRVLSDRNHVSLGQEYVRYSTMRKADEEAVRLNHTCLPFLSDPDRFDKLGTDLFHDIIEKIWPDDGPIPWKSAEEYRGIVEFLDEVPPQIQSQLGRWFLKKRSELADGSYLPSGLIRLDKRDRIVFACSHMRDWANKHEWSAELSLLTSFRHLQACESGAALDTRTLGVGALVEDRSENTSVSYIFFMVKGQDNAPNIPKDLRRSFERTYGIHDHASGRTLQWGP